jgi:hypothetical protein
MFHCEGVCILNTIARLTGWLALMAATASPALLPAATAVAADPDRAEITGLLRKTWEKPETPLSADPVVISGDHAIADWHQGDHAGRALLRKASAGWSVVLCAGDALTEPAFLVEAGVPAAQAEVLTQALVKAEQPLAPDRKAQMSRFKNVVRMHP